MPADKITQLLDGTFSSPDGGMAGVSTRALVISPSLRGMELDLVKSLDLGRHLAIVSDETTHAVLGKRLEDALRGSFRVTSVVFPAGPHPDDATVVKLRGGTVFADALIAVGSGTINDLCKFASASDGKPYAVFATAPSMNGYTSLNAAITEHGHKKSLPAQAPTGAFFDLAILSAAPARMIRSGLGDSLCRATAQADWLLAHLLFNHPYRQLPYALLEDDETPLFEQSGALMMGDIQAMERLVRTLVLSGFGTAICGTSEPASQGEHLISHYIDMLGDPNRSRVFHGEQVGVTTLSMARLQERMLDGTPIIEPDRDDESDFVERYGETLGSSCWKDFARKRLDAGAADCLNQRLSAGWDRMRERIASVRLAASHLLGVLDRAGAPTRPEEIYLSRSFYETAILRSRDIRSRYTFLDLAANNGRLAKLAPTM
jgi:glycerol-1-phosphate dehydrogenase [NAD(P)+]